MPTARTGNKASAKRPLLKALARAAHRQLNRLAVTWSVPTLKKVTLAVHPTLKRTIARYDPSTRTIELRADAANSTRLTAVLVHEAAHAAVCEKHGIHRTRPHGPEWRRLMSAAGHAPKTRLALGHRCLAPQQRKQADATSQPRYDHWCPVCQTSRKAKKRMKHWRCADCVRDGLPGRLEITSKPVT
jgi:predicted SprT family Zn-dependent metalloprotease